MTKYPKIVLCRARLMKENIGLASMLMPLPLIEDDTLPTMATDGTCIRYNPSFVEEHSSEQIQGVLIHEACHVLFEHPLRKGKRNHKLWNVACDYAINNYLIYDTDIDLVEGGMWDIKYRGMSAEKIYSILDEDEKSFKKAIDQMNNQRNFDKANNDQSSSPDTDEDNTADDQDNSKSSNNEEEKNPGDKYDQIPESIGEVFTPVDENGKELSHVKMQEISEEIKRNVRMADKYCSMDGTAGLTESIKGDQLSKIRWNDHLRESLTSIFKTETSWKSLNRRHQFRGIHLPARNVAGKGGIVAIANDTSASVTSQELEYYASESQKILEDCGIEKVYVCYCDSTVRKNDKGEWWDIYDLTAGDTLNFEPRGRGGTRFEPVFNLLADYTEQLDEIQALIYFTDGYANISQDYEPDFPVFWGISSNLETKALREYIPFGELIRIDNEDCYRD